MGKHLVLGFLLEVTLQACSKGAGLGWTSSLSSMCTEMSVSEDRDTFTSLQEHFIQIASRFAAMTNCQELYQKPVEL